MMTTPLKTYFEGRALPQIDTIVLPNWAHNVLRACPEVRHVTCSGDDGGKLVSAIGASCKNVEVLLGIRPDKAIINRE